MEALRGWMTGFGVPTFVIDTPGGGGKVPIGPNYLLTMGEQNVMVRNFEGRIHSYPQPKDRDTSVAYEAKWFGDSNLEAASITQGASDSPKTVRLPVLKAADCH